jgi:hypothetical protein
MVRSIDLKKSPQKTVKAFEPDIVLINEQAKRLGCSAAEVIHRMCEEIRKQVYLKELGESFDSLKTNAKSLAAFELEQQAWNCALADGLENASEG